MLDVKYIVQNPDLVAKNAANKNEKKADIPRICALQEQKKEIQLRLDQKRELSNKKSQEIGQIVTAAKKRARSQIRQRSRRSKKKRKSSPTKSKRSKRNSNRSIRRSRA